MSVAIGLEYGKSAQKINFASMHWTVRKVGQFKIAGKDNLAIGLATKKQSSAKEWSLGCVIQCNLEHSLWRSSALCNDYNYLKDSKTYVAVV